MKLSNLATALLVSTAMSFAANSALQDNEKNNMKAQLLAATDARDAESPVFDEALKAKKFEALAYIGQIGGDACQNLIPYLRGENLEAKSWAAKGAMLCHDPELSALLLEQMAAATDKAPWAKALGYSGAEVHKEILAEMLNNNRGETDAESAALFALVQAVAYDSTKAADIKGLDANALLGIVANGSNPYAAAYVLARLQEVPKVISYEAFSAVFSAQLSNLHKVSAAHKRAKGHVVTSSQLQAARLMTRLAREYGDKSLQLLLAAIETTETAIRHEAIRSLGYLSDSTSKTFLSNVANSESAPVERHLAVEALGRRSAADMELVGVLEQYVSDDNLWVATTALRALGQRDAASANEIAAEWLSGGDYYLAFQALIALTGSDEGKAVLQVYADANPETVRGYEAAVALDPSIEAVTKARKTPTAATLAAYEGRQLILETTRGNICIAMTGDAPYAATNFLQLADVGKMDGMLWHRVIPNFVSQAGQVEDKSINDWGSIREEWGGEHRIGTVGVATAGRDTGTVQFFINTGYNMHLNNRYTVFGKVSSSMDIVYALEEGDVITKARTEKSDTAACK